MLNTGFISFVTETAGGFDAFGNPIAATKVLSTYRPCNILTLTKEYRLLVDGEYKAARFSVIIDNSEISDLVLTDLKEIDLQDSENLPLGAFQVQNREPLPFMNKLKIVV